MVEMDRIDSEIVGLLQKNGRLSNKEIAAEVGLAPSSCWERVQRLVAAGVFAGFHAEVDPRAMGVGLQAVVAVRLARHRRDQLDKFRRKSSRHPKWSGSITLRDGTISWCTWPCGTRTSFASSSWRASPPGPR
ncbi:MAG: Lrp/AsnC family transcriptional regulator [Gemmatimonadales bacterium]